MLNSRLVGALFIWLLIAAAIGVYGQEVGRRAGRCALRKNCPYAFLA